MAHCPRITCPSCTAPEALAWPPTGPQCVWKPLGGFACCPLPYLLRPWELYEADKLPWLSVRLWCAAVELPERRFPHLLLERPVRYSLEELRQILHVARLGPVRDAVHALEDQQLLHWSDHRLTFFPGAEALAAATAPEPPPPLHALLPSGRTWVPVPRRLLRWLAHDGTPGRYATAAGVLLRCLWSKRRHCVSGGRVAPSWITRAFGVAERTVQRALEEFQDLQWLARLPNTTPQAARTAQRAGAYTVINMAWSAPGSRPARPRPGRRPAAPLAAPVAALATPALAPGEAVADDRNLAPLPPPACRNLAPPPASDIPVTSSISTVSKDLTPRDLYPLQGRTDSVPVYDVLICARLDTDPTPEAFLTTPPAVLATDDLSAPQGISYTHDNKHPTAPGPEAHDLLPHLPSPPVPEADLPPACAANDIAPTLPDTADADQAAIWAAYGTDAVACPTRSAAPAAPEVVATTPASPPCLPPDPALLFAALPAAAQEELLDAAAARLLAEGRALAWLIRPVLLADVYAHLAPPEIPPEASVPLPPGTTVVPGTTVGPAPVAPAVTPWAPETSAPPLAPPRWQHLLPADLEDLGRLETLYQQAVRWGWFRASTAMWLNVVTAAVHAKRLGDQPCALFAAVVRRQHWHLLTDQEEDQARVWLRGPRPPAPVAPAAPAMPLSNDASFVRLVLPLLRRIAVHGDLFAAMQAQYPDWTRPRWEAALAEALGRRVAPGMERLGRVLEDGA